jgi:lactoylglutathione lyase
MKYLHTMVRVSNLEESLDFYCNKLGLIESHRKEYEKARFSLIFLSAPDDCDRVRDEKAPLLELTHNWDPQQYPQGKNFGHLAYEVDNIYETCQKLLDQGITINRPPRDGYMAFIKSPDNISIEFLQKGDRLEPKEPWTSMENTGVW